MDAPTAATPAAPAQPVAEPMQSAVEAAISKSPAEYRAAKAAERVGKPLPSVPVAASDPSEPAPAAAAAPAQPQLSRKERDQQDANERTRRAVEAATADLRAELDRVKASTAAPRSEPAAAPAEPPARMAEKFPSIDVWGEQNPGKTFDDYLDARDEFRTEQRTKAQQVEQGFKARAEELTKRGQEFSNRVEAARAIDPDFAQKIPPAMRDPKASIPLSALSSDQIKTATFSNLVAEAAFRSEQPIALLQYLHANQAESVRIAGIAQQRGTVEALIALERIDERIKTARPAAPAQPSAQKPKKITSAPAPQETLGNRPAEVVDPETAAIKGGTRAFRQLRAEQRAQQFGRR